MAMPTIHNPCHRASRVIPRLVPGLLAPLVLTACVELDETIVVDRRGRAQLEVVMDADGASELRPGRVPHVEDGWKVTRGEEQEDGGVALRAVRNIDADEPFPAWYGTGATQYADTELSFPTEVTIERRGGATYYHFRRVYEARPWADVSSVEAALRKQYGLGDDAGLKLDDMSDDQRVQLIRGVVMIEVNKTLVLARAAFLDTAPEAPQDAWLAARREALDYAEAIDYGYFAALIRASDDPLAQLKLQQEGERFEEGIQSALDRALIEADVEPSTVSAFVARLGWYRHQRQVSEELGMQKFRIHVTLPGTIVASNANRVDGDTVHWAFDGTLMHDRPVELLATSRIP